MSTLRAGVIGVGNAGMVLLEELDGNDLFELTAISDSNRELSQEYGRQYEVGAYDDNRSLIVQEKLDILFLMLPTFQCGECIQLAAKRGIHVFKHAPLARTLPEANEWVKLMNRAGLKFYVGAPRRFAPGYLHAHLKLQQGRIGEVYLARAESFLNFEGNFDWRGDPLLAGGGVLLEQAYHMIDQMVWDLGTPEQLYSLNTSQCSTRVLPPYRTEDTVALTMKFSQGMMGNVLAGWMTGPACERLLLHGTGGSIEVNANHLQIYDETGKLVEEDKYHVDENWMIAQQLRHFADSLLDEEVKPISTAQEHLANVAIVDSAYLSARTQQPETLKVYVSLFEIE
jgi:UDP-N-acetyl-2-amino-2-deoxyglucuronate dehydrogenase